MSGQDTVHRVSQNAKGADPKTDAFMHHLLIAGIIEAYGNLFPQVEAVCARVAGQAGWKTAEVTSAGHGRTRDKITAELWL
jgi:hypothetical protein